MATKPFVLTKDYIYHAFKPLEEVEDLEKRSAFFRNFIVDDVVWEIAGTAHELAGRSNSLAEHNAATFDRLGRGLMPEFLVQPEIRIKLTADLRAFYYAI